MPIQVISSLAPRPKSEREKLPGERKCREVGVLGFPLEAVKSTAIVQARSKS